MERAKFIKTEIYSLSEEPKQPNCRRLYKAVRLCFRPTQAVFIATLKRRLILIEPLLHFGSLKKLQILILSQIVHQPDTLSMESVFIVMVATNLIIVKV